MLGHELRHATRYSSLLGAEVQAGVIAVPFSCMGKSASYAVRSRGDSSFGCKRHELRYGAYHRLLRNATVKM